MQQHLARQHMLLEKELDEVNNSRSLREVGETTLGQLRELYNQLQEQYKMDRQQSIGFSQLITNKIMLV